MPQATMRCVAGAAVLSLIVGSMAYEQSERSFKGREEAFRELAGDECLANDPFKIHVEDSEEGTITRIRRLQALHRVCHYSVTGVVEP
jgi:hypothetical protein